MLFKYCILVACLVGVALCTSGGAPLEACDTMVPQHGVTAQTTPPPYTVLVQKVGLNYTATIKANSASNLIRGFISQVRGASNQRIGRYDFAADDEYVRGMDCDGVAASSVTHKNTLVDRDIFSLNWIAPSATLPAATLKLTIVKQGAIFWTGIEVNLLTVADARTGA